MTTPLTSQQVTLLLRGGRVLRTGSARPEILDIAIDAGGSIVRIASAIHCYPDVPVADISGWLVTPGLVDIHQHLDKTATRRIVTNEVNTLKGAIAAFESFATGLSREDVMTRAQRTVEACIARGTVAIRSHVNVGTSSGLRGIEALAELRQRMSGRIRLQIVAFLTRDAGYSPGAAANWLEDAIAAGAESVGGAPAHAEDPDAFLDVVFEAAQRRDVSVDLHVDEHLDSATHRFQAIAERTEALGLQGRVIAGHCSALSALSKVDADRIIERLATAEIGVVTLPAANLYLLGRDADRLPPRGLTRVKDLIAGGVTVAAGSDNIQDPFVPVGTGDLLETARWTFLAAQFDARELGAVFCMVTTVPAEMMKLSNYGIYEGARADLLITEAEDEEDLVASGANRRIVFVGGKLAAGQIAITRAEQR